MSFGSLEDHDDEEEDLRSHHATELQRLLRSISTDFSDLTATFRFIRVNFFQLFSTTFLDDTNPPSQAVRSLQSRFVDLGDRLGLAEDLRSMTGDQISDELQSELQELIDEFQVVLVR